MPTLSDQDRFWSSHPADWRFISATGIADAFYTTTEPGKAMMKVRKRPLLNQLLVLRRVGLAAGELVA